MKKSTFLMFSIIIALSLANLYFLLNPQNKVKANGSFFSCSQLLSHANSLASKKIYEEAADVYGQYIDSCAEDGSDAARTYVSMGNMFYTAGKYAKALANFYKAEMLDETLSGLINEKVVYALENLNMTKEARFEEEKRVSIEPEKVDGKGKVIAKIGNRLIYEDVLDDILEDLPQELKAVSASAQVRNMLIQKYVQEEALYIKARRKGLDKDPKVAKLLEQTQRQALLNSLVQKDILSKVQEDQPQGLADFYEKRKEEFRQDPSMGIVFVEIKDKQKKAEADLDAKKEEDIVWIDDSFVYIPGLGEAQETIDRLWKLQEGQVGQAEKIEGKEYLFKVVKKEPGGYLSFEEVKDQLLPEYRQERLAEITEEYMKNLIEEEEIEFFPDEVMLKRSENISDAGSEKQTGLEQKKDEAAEKEEE